MTAAGTIELTCVVCGESWTMRRRRGLYPTRCARCERRGMRNVPCEACGRRRQARGKRRLGRWCAACAPRLEREEAKRSALADAVGRLGLELLTDERGRHYVVMPDGWRAYIDHEIDLQLIACDLRDGAP